jgi:hypothetical protein
MIKFEQGSGRYDSGAEIYRFNATDDEGRVPCAISREALEYLSRLPVDLNDPTQLFDDWEMVVFDLARDKYNRGERQEGGAVVIRAGDGPGGRH